MKTNQPDIWPIGPCKYQVNMADLKKEDIAASYNQKSFGKLDTINNIHYNYKIAQSIVSSGWQEMRRIVEKTALSGWQEQDYGKHSALDRLVSKQEKRRIVKNTGSSGQRWQEKREKGLRKNLTVGFLVLGLGWW